MLGLAWINFLGLMLKIVLHATHFTNTQLVGCSSSCIDEWTILILCFEYHSCSLVCITLRVRRLVLTWVWAFESIFFSFRSGHAHCHSALSNRLRRKTGKTSLCISSPGLGIWRSSCAWKVQHAHGATVRAWTYLYTQESGASIVATTRSDQDQTPQRLGALSHWTCVINVL